MSRINLTGIPAKTGAPINPNSKVGRVRELILPEMETISLRATDKDKDYLAEIVHKIAKSRDISVRTRFVRRESRLYVERILP